jgi:rhamnosyltransferase
MSEFGSRSDVLAVVVTYNPGPELRHHLRAIREQVSALLVIDNASENSKFVARIARETNCRLVNNDENLGVATALNQAARIALDEGFEWLATFDQDSLVAVGSIEALRATYITCPQREQVAIVAMSHKDRATGREYHLPGDVITSDAAWRSVRTTITSGSMVRTTVFSDVGLFDDLLFIDCVDHDFCLRCRRSGYIILESTTATLSHSLGEATNRALLGINFSNSNHTSTRRYYMVRNNLAIFKRYVTFDAKWCLITLLHVFGDCFVSLVFETNRYSKLLAMLCGARDFLLGRFGPHRVTSAASM